MLTAEEKRELLRTARESIASGFQGGRASSLPPHHEPSCGYAGALLNPGGAFVTLHLKGKLRGCIGHIESVDPVWRVVKDVAAKSAFHDPRFPPLRAEELKQIDVEISLLSPLAEIRDIGEIEVGVHGLLLELGNHRGLLLPQVATEHGWTREEFLDHTAWKAGLKPEAWKDPRASIHIFTAEIIEESHVAAQ